MKEISSLCFLLHSDWSDWEEHPVSAVCLFCEKHAETIEKLSVHMKVRYFYSFEFCFILTRTSWSFTSDNPYHLLFSVSQSFSHPVRAMRGPEKIVWTLDTTLHAIDSYSNPHPSTTYGPQYPQGPLMYEEPEIAPWVLLGMAPEQNKFLKIKNEEER